MSTIDELKVKLVKAREANEQAKQNAGLRRINMETTPEGVEYSLATAEFAIASEAMLAADKELREAALAIYNSTGSPKDISCISPGVTIQFHHKIKYDTDAVIAWCWEKYKGLILLDKKEFEKVKPNGAPFEKYDEPFVKLATKNEDFNLPKG
jgi:hypothetical protein